MASTFVSIDPAKMDKTGVFHNTPPVPVWLQFVPGIVKNVIVNDKSIGYGSFNDINAILAKPHISDEITMIDIGDKKYYPLFRGIAEAPVKGDQVLLCTFAGINYYLGPINTQNSPNKNTDNVYTPNTSDINVNILNKLGVTSRDVEGYSNNFKIIPHKRLNKPDNPILDGVNSNGTDIYDHHGDMLFEGRHGNSIRIGSRNVNPYIFISNGRNPITGFEGLGDGSLISITDHGSLNDHFKEYIDLNKKEKVIGFQLASDKKASDYGDSAKLVTAMIRDVNGDTDSAEIFNNYLRGQILINSDRITINCKKESMFLSAFQHVHIGAGRSLTISSNMETVIDSNAVRMGKNAKDPMVLGQVLVDTLTELVDIIKNIQIFPSPSSTIPWHTVPTNVANVNKLEILKGNLTKFLSGKHYVE